MKKKEEPAPIEGTKIVTSIILIVEQAEKKYLVFPVGDSQTRYDFCLDAFSGITHNREEWFQTALNKLYSESLGLFDLRDKAAELKASKKKLIHSERSQQCEVFVVRVQIDDEKIESLEHLIEQNRNELLKMFDFQIETFKQKLTEDNSRALNIVNDLIEDAIKGRCNFIERDEIDFLRQGVPQYRFKSDCKGLFTQFKQKLQSLPALFSTLEANRELRSYIISRLCMRLVFRMIFENPNKFSDEFIALSKSVKETSDQLVKLSIYKTLEQNSDNIGKVQPRLNTRAEYVLNVYNKHLKDRLDEFPVIGLKKISQNQTWSLNNLAINYQLNRLVSSPPNSSQSQSEQQPQTQTSEEEQNLTKEMEKLSLEKNEADKQKK